MCCDIWHSVEVLAKIRFAIYVISSLTILWAPRVWVAGVGRVRMGAPYHDSTPPALTHAHHNTKAPECHLPTTSLCVVSVTHKIRWTTCCIYRYI